MIERVWLTQMRAEYAANEFGNEDQRAIVAREEALGELRSVTGIVNGTPRHDVVKTIAEYADELVSEAKAILRFPRALSKREQMIMNMLGMEVLDVGGETIADLKLKNPNLLDVIDDSFEDELYASYGTKIALNRPDLLEISGTLKLDKPMQIGAVELFSQPFEEGSQTGVKAIMLPAALLIQADLAYMRLHEDNHILPEGRAIRTLDGGLDKDFFAIRRGESYSVLSYPPMGINRIGAVPGLVFYHQDKLIDSAI